MGNAYRQGMLGEEIKNQISHRARAVNKLLDYLKQRQ